MSPSETAPATALQCRLAAAAPEICIFPQNSENFLNFKLL
jgi:hypothetical protein